jgi:agmatine deiminase
MGYRMPAEWEQHEGTWLAWPKNQETFTSDHLVAVRRTYARIISELCTGERVHLLVDDRGAQKEALAFVGQNRNLVFHSVWSADVWVRDYGPIFVKNSGVAATKWTFNAWGNKYDDLLPDNETGRAVLRESGLPGFVTNMVLEGGSIDVNGRGFLLTTKQCLLNKNRNPSMTASEIETALRDNLGADRVIWVEEGIEGDDTDGHIDDIARFVAHDTVVCMTERGEGSRNQEILSANLDVLRKAKDPGGHPLKIEEIPMPSPVKGVDGMLPASYANFYIGNSVVLVPTFADPNDGKALRIIDRLFPSRRVVGLDCRSLVSGFGAIHCVTQQQPAGF